MVQALDKAARGDVKNGLIFAGSHTKSALQGIVLTDADAEGDKEKR